MTTTGEIAPEDRYPDTGADPRHVGMSSSLPGPTSPSDMGIGELIANVTGDFSLLMRQEVELAKAEAKESATRAGKGVGMFGGAGVTGNLALTFLSLALAWWIGSGLNSLGWGALVVGVLWGIVAATLALVGKRNLKDLGMPRTTQTAARIPDALKGDEQR